MNKDLYEWDRNFSRRAFGFYKTMTKEIVYSSLEEIQEVAKKIILFSEDKKVWLFEGEMGAGKTTLIKAICACLGVTDNVTSPTYSLVNEYQSRDNNTLYHFDFYRIKNESEALDMGIEEYFYSGGYCFVEWPSKIPNLLPEAFLEIVILEMDGIRKIQLNKY